ncbi:hypothetical protein COU80_05235 [Candidatus Peregrinibacteria bacterium CG10_big_fil_rev_8_21_14_0_10_55_24]|nr:MAG: hypothetical protein COU80_05235 [Candidatus Peregrinibacteria bacterium CG10_big_fil_rev_8_21_14_0_10_55_24]
MLIGAACSECGSRLRRLLSAPRARTARKSANNAAQCPCSQTVSSKIIREADAIAQSIAEKNGVKLVSAFGSADSSSGKIHNIVVFTEPDHTRN